MAFSTQARTITLYAPSIDKTIDEFTFRPNRAYRTIQKNIRQVFGDIDQAWPYDLKRKPIKDFKQVQMGTTLLIATCFFERPLAEEVKEVVVVQPGAAEKAWMELGPEKKREYIAALEKGTIYVTLSLTETQSRLVSNAQSSFESCLAAIEKDNWCLPLDAILGFRGMVMPYGEMGTWEKSLLPTLAVLSEATLDQGVMVSALLIDEVKRTRREVLETAHVLEVGKRLFRKAAW